MMETGLTVHLGQPDVDGASFTSYQVIDDGRTSLEEQLSDVVQALPRYLNHNYPCTSDVPGDYSWPVKAVSLVMKPYDLYHHIDVDRPENLTRLNWYKTAPEPLRRQHLLFDEYQLLVATEASQRRGGDNYHIETKEAAYGGAPHRSPPQERGYQINIFGDIGGNPNLDWVCCPDTGQPDHTIWGDKCGCCHSRPPTNLIFASANVYHYPHPDKLIQPLPQANVGEARFTFRGETWEYYVFPSPTDFVHQADYNLTSYYDYDLPRQAGLHCEHILAQLASTSTVDLPHDTRDHRRLIEHVGGATPYQNASHTDTPVAYSTGSEEVPAWFTPIVRPEHQNHPEESRNILTLGYYTHDHTSESLKTANWVEVATINFTYDQDIALLSIDRPPEHSRKEPAIDLGCF